MNNNKKHLIYYFIIVFTTLFIASYIILLFLQKKVVEVKLEEIRNNEQRIVEMEHAVLAKEMTTIVSELHYLHEVHETELTNTEDYSVIANNWEIFSEKRQIYDQVRFIDLTGEEKIRINYKNLDAVIVTESKLQNKKDRYYFYKTMELEREETFVSQLDLNVEGEKIEIPYKPMLRFSTPIYDDESIRGIIIFNYLAEDILKEFRELAFSSSGEIMLLNSKGYWLSSENREDEWNFMFDYKKDRTFVAKYPKEWEKIIAGEKQFHTSNGLFSSEELNINTEMQLDSSIILGEGTWYIVSRVTQYDSVEVGYLIKQRLLSLDVLRKNMYYFLFMSLLSIVIGILIYLNRKAYLRTKFYSEFDALTQIYNRRAGMSKLKDIVVADRRRRPKVSLCYIDINGLKDVNDQLGHKLGDELIIKTISIIKSVIRDNDFIMRLGGDEFMIVLIDVDASKAENVWFRIKSSCNLANTTENRQYIISLSHGIVDFERDEEIEIDDLIKIADEKMYVEKKIIKKDIRIIRPIKDNNIE